jgi:DnaJ-class molecular chaperone
MDHYEVLGLPSPNYQDGLKSSERPTEADIKQAYRTALLKYHPDKANGSSGVNPGGYASQADSTGSKPSIDVIKQAYEVLLDPRARAEYDRELLLRQSSTLKASNGVDDKEKHFRTGEEVVDLDELQYDEEKGFWYRACRCGEAVSYVVTEKMLEAEERKGLREIVVGCVGCSLWLRVAFGVSEEHGDARG